MVNSFQQAGKHTIFRLSEATVAQHSQTPPEPPAHTFRPFLFEPSPFSFPWLLNLCLLDSPVKMSDHGQLNATCPSKKLTPTSSEGSANYLAG